MSAVTARAGYRLWAPSYVGETAVSRLEHLTVAALAVSTVRRTLLDVGCGTARRLRESAAALAIGVDLTFEMLAEASGSHSLATADVRALPFGGEVFDVVWCRLVVGHVQDLEIAYAELSRVCRTGGEIVVSDISPEAIAAGHRRVFRDSSGAEHELEHYVHMPANHSEAGSEAKLELIALRDGVVGAPIRDFYRRAGRLAAYEEQLGLPLVRALWWRKVGRRQQ